jgi:hypothetical protein
MRKRPVMLAVAMFICALCAGPSLAHADSVYVKYRGEVDLNAFDCTDIARSSFINRVCYDQRNKYMLISLNGTYYHYCEIDAGTVSSLLNAHSMGAFYNANIKGDFDCRKNRVPEYRQEQQQDLDGSTMYSRCTGDDENWQLWCLGYVGGSSDAFVLFNSGKAPNVCLPADGTHGQVQTIIVKYLRDHPEYLQRPALETVLSALVAAFPCR